MSQLHERLERVHVENEFFAKVSKSIIDQRRKPIVKPSDQIVSKSVSIEKINGGIEKNKQDSDSQQRQDNKEIRTIRKRVEWL